MSVAIYNDTLMKCKECGKVCLPNDGIKFEQFGNGLEVRNTCKDCVRNLLMLWGL